MNEKVLQLQRFHRTLSFELGEMRTEYEHISEHGTDFVSIFQDAEVATQLFPDPASKSVNEIGKDAEKYQSHIIERTRKLNQRIKIAEELNKRILNLLEYKLANPYRIPKKKKKESKIVFNETMTLFEKIKSTIEIEDVLQSLPMIINNLRLLGENIKPNTEEFAEEYKKSASNIAATLKIYTDRGEIQRCKLDSSHLFYYGLTSWFVGTEPIDEYIPQLTE